MEDSARIWIRLVDPERDGHPVVHISVVNTSPSDDSRRWLISHLPFDPAALSESSLTLTDERQRWDLEEDDFGSGYAIWREAFDFGKAGVFTEPVPAVVYTLLQQAK